MSTPKRVFKLAIVRANGCGMCVRLRAPPKLCLPTPCCWQQHVIVASISRSSFFFFFFLKLCRVISAPDTHMVKGTVLKASLAIRLSRDFCSLPLSFGMYKM